MNTGKSSDEDRMILITCHFPPGVLARLDELIEKGFFPNRSEAIRTGSYFILTQMGMAFNTATATNAHLFKDFLEGQKHDIAKDILADKSPKKTQQEMKEKGLSISKEEIHAIDKEPSNPIKAHTDQRIKELCAEGMELDLIAAKLDVSYGHVYYVVKKAGIYIPKKDRHMDEESPSEKPIEKNPPIDKVKCARKQCPGCFYYRINAEDDTKMKCYYGEL
jgi:Arc/MetJ-type ribon-helix-helix transcriptional regulator